MLQLSVSWHSKIYTPVGWRIWLVQKKLWEILYLLICSFLSCLSWLLRSRVWKFWRDLWITLYIEAQEDGLKMVLKLNIIHVRQRKIWLQTASWLKQPFNLMIFLVEQNVLKMWKIYRFLGFFKGIFNCSDYTVLNEVEKCSQMLSSNSWSYWPIRKQCTSICSDRWLRSMKKLEYLVLQARFEVGTAWM